MRILLVIVLSFAAMLCGVSAATIAPTPQDRQTFELGVRQQQAIDIFSDPRECGIVLMRPYCRDAFTALAGNTAAIPGLEAYFTSGNIDDYDKKWADANAVGFTDAAWQAKPRDEWLQAAGAMYAAYYVPEWDAYSTMQVLVYRQLVRYAGSAVPYDSLLAAADLKAGPDGVGIDGPARIAKYFVPALGAVFPPAMEPALKDASGAIADAQTGVYFSTALQMFESPVLFLAPTSRGFFQRLSTRLGDPDLGRQFLTASGPDAWRAAVTKLQEDGGSRLKAMPEKPREMFLFGRTAAQAAYNAAILREKPAEDQQLKVLKETSNAVPKSVATKLPPVLAARGDWHALNETASALTMEIMNE